MTPEKKYLTIPNEPYPVAIKEISEEEFTGYKNDSETIRKFEYYKSRLTEIDFNKDSFHNAKRHYTELLKKNQTEHIDYDFKAEAHIELNRTFINFITSFKSLIEHCEKKIAKNFTEESKEFKGFKEYIRNLHSESFAYKLADQMRNYAVHSTYPIDIVNFDIISYDLSKTDNMFEVGVFISRELIENSKTLRKKFSQHLSEIGDGVEIVPILREVRILIEKILKKFIVICESEFIDSANRLIQLTEEKYERLGLTYLEQKGMKINYHSILIPIESSRYLINLTNNISA
jgi:hypothetical protein